MPAALKTPADAVKAVANGQKKKAPLMNNRNQKESKKKPPQKESKQQPPQNESKKKPPQKESKQQPPQKESKQQPPQKESKQQPPQNESKKQPPQKSKKQPPQKELKKQPPQKELKKQPPQMDPKQQPQYTEFKQQQLRLRLLLLAAVVSTCVGLCLVAAMLLLYRSRHNLQRQLPPNVSIPARQLVNYDNGSFTSNWWRLDQCIRKLNCPPDFFACRAVTAMPDDATDANQLSVPLYLWHHFLLLGWALFTCHQAAGMRQLFLTPVGVAGQGD
ncbi:hypothetical protein BOX15_Mlig024374g1 [Macrostomum lignano]|uniref:Uncharacterized protein n=1 Tax=Macrostomum lignano TaxID=282301 RepID=A0A267GP22_9PLAT|nr:hypothetical protein BOX15_Mlig024374g1 [Macrostomum lignano]